MEGVADRSHPLPGIRRPPSSSAVARSRARGDPKSIAYEYPTELALGIDGTDAALDSSADKAASHTIPRVSPAIRADRARRIVQRVAAEEDARRERAARVIQRHALLWMYSPLREAVRRFHNDRYAAVFRHAAVAIQAQMRG
eukprot:TRINITY_DN67594_c0_g1_i2.p1 TRINITY_DN67594_c0_g1~~TRINITY_DN67594_c0_g1_i2.p1  ORF type:complete len:142 (-),score=3.13 TRINITY_DN67594_c0_g1_i2:96-521(-)